MVCAFVATANCIECYGRWDAVQAISLCEYLAVEAFGRISAQKEKTRTPCTKAHYIIVTIVISSTNSRRYSPLCHVCC